MAEMKGANITISIRKVERNLREVFRVKKITNMQKPAGGGECSRVLQSVAKCRVIYISLYYYCKDETAAQRTSELVVLVL